VLRAGGTVAFPTETVYGLGALAFDSAAVARIFEIKRRPSFDPLIVHVAGRAMLDEVVAGVPPAALALIEAFWPGPLTLVLRKSAAIGDLVTAGASTVAVRMPSHPVARALLEAIGAPLAAPSANPFGALSPTHARHVAAHLGARVDLILDGGPAEHGIESTIVALEPRPLLLRPGAIPVEEIEAIAGPLDREAEGAPIVPGRLPQHYSPATRLRVIDPALVAPAQRQGAASLALSHTFGGYDVSRALSSEGDLRVAAARFFETLHELDAMGVVRIDAQPFPESGLGLAIMDRLRRAAARNS
jgi:L-threonylcarbamoyladenylate synthase